MISLLIYVLVVLLIFGVVLWAIEQLPMPPNLKLIARLIVVLILVLILVNMLIGIGPLHRPLLN